jgi:prolyl 4-hydroxylase
MVAAPPILASVQRLLDAGRLQSAARMLNTAADGGDLVAIIELAQWRIAGTIIRRDLASARALFERAWSGGSEAAGLLYAAFLASEVGGPADWMSALGVLRALAPNNSQAARQLSLIDAMALTSDGAPATPIARQHLSVSPHIDLAHGLFTPQECAYLLAVGAPHFQRSLVADPRTGRMIPHPVRRSDAAMLGVHTEDVAINALNRRIAAFSGTAAAQGEPLQLLRYRPGDEYRTHLDVLAGERNQRQVTVLVALSDDHEGGETAFTRTALKLRGRRGDAILFRNVTSSGQPDPMAEHAGLPVTRGVKHIASRWIRRERFTFPAPKPLVEM